MGNCACCCQKPTPAKPRSIKIELVRQDVGGWYLQPMQSTESQYIEIPNSKISDQEGSVIDYALEKCEEYEALGFEVEIVIKKPDS